MTDKFELWAETHVTINVLDVNEAPSLSYSDNYVDENTDLGTPLAIAPDYSDPDAVSVYRFELVDPPADLPFEVDPATGVLSVDGALDYETTRNYTMTVRVYDGSTLAPTDLHADAQARVIVQDVNEPPWVTGAAFAVFENVSAGTVVFESLEAGDPDAADQGRLVYQSLTSEDGDSPFGFYQNSKQIKVINTLNYEVRVPLFSSACGSGRWER